MAAAVSVGSGSGRRGGLPQSAAMMNLLTDMAFNLLIFFVVLADPSTETGRSQQIPSADKDTTPQVQQDSIKVELKHPDTSSNRLFVNGDPITMAELPAKITKLLEGKQKPDERIVVISEAKDVPYHWHIQATSRIEQAGGVVALQTEETKEVTLPSR